MCGIRFVEQIDEVKGHARVKLQADDSGFVYLRRRVHVFPIPSIERNTERSSGSANGQIHGKGNASPTREHAL